MWRLAVLSVSRPFLPNRAGKSADTLSVLYALQVSIHILAMYGTSSLISPLDPVLETCLGAQAQPNLSLCQPFTGAASC